ncbi:MAG: ribose-5-phosphate isomerase [Gemmatimonadetes bacterium]|nr:MAG: ribose-5-phosphate isomerase [Gemmatimonadota bacterium]
MSERIFVGADHAGFQLKERLVNELKRLGYEPVDVGPKTMNPADDFPDYGRPVAEAVSSGAAKRGVLTCGTGLGMSYVANRFLPARFVSEEEGMEILHKWLDTAFEGGRHERRVGKIDS